MGVQDVRSQFLKVGIIEQAGARQRDAQGFIDRAHDLQSRDRIDAVLGEHRLLVKQGPIHPERAAQFAGHGRVHALVQRERILPRIFSRRFRAGSLRGAVGGYRAGDPADAIGIDQQHVAGIHAFDR